MTTWLKKPPGHFMNESAAENAVQFAFALVLEDIDVEVSSVVKDGKTWMLLRCTNSKEQAFKRLCEQYHPDAMVETDGSLP